jgi:hypothetical protein
LIVPLMGELPLNTYFMKKSIYPQAKKLMKAIS